MKSHGLVNIARACPGAIVDMRYATLDNHWNRILYDGGSAWLLEGTARKLAAAEAEAERRGLRLVVLDAYRPLSVQRVMFELTPFPGFVASPERGSIHNRGAAVDVTLADLAGALLPMPSGFDDFSERASHDYAGGDAAALGNRAALRAIMEGSGFSFYDAEWWHYTDGGSRASPLLDLSISELEAGERA